MNKNKKDLKIGRSSPLNLLLLFSCSTVSNSLQPHELKHARLGVSVLCYLPEFLQTHIHWVSDAIQPSHPLSSPSPPAFNLSQEGLFQWVGSSRQVAKASASASVLPMNIQGWFPLGWTGLISLLSKGLSRVLSRTTIWKHQLFGTQSSLWSNSHICTWLLEKTINLTIWTFVGKVMSLLFDTLSRFVIVFIPKGKHLLISWLWI